MSKYVKEPDRPSNLQARLDGVQRRCCWSTSSAWTPTNTSACGKSCGSKNIKLMVVKNSLARRATEGTPLAPAFEGVEGTLAVVWGGEDIVVAGQGSRRSWPSDKEFAAVRGPRRRDGRRRAARPTKSSRSASGPAARSSSACWSGQILVAGRQAGQPADRAPAARWPARSSRRAKARKKPAAAEAPQPPSRRQSAASTRQQVERTSDRDRHPRHNQHVRRSTQSGRASPARGRASRPSEKGQVTAMATDAATTRILRRHQGAGRQDRRPDAQAGQGTERLPRRSPRHQAGRRRRGDDGRPGRRRRRPPRPRKRRPSSTSCWKASATRRSA